MDGFLEGFESYTGQVEPPVIDKEQYLLLLQEEFPEMFPEGEDISVSRGKLQARFLNEYHQAIGDYYGEEDPGKRGWLGANFKPVWENEAERLAVTLGEHGDSYNGNTSETYRLPTDVAPVMEAHRRYEFMKRLMLEDHDLTTGDVEIGTKGGGDYWRKGVIPMNWFPNAGPKMFATDNGPQYFDAQESSAMGEAVMGGRDGKLATVLNAFDPATGLSAYRESMAGNADTMGTNIGQTYNENVHKQGSGGVKTSQLPVFQEDGTPTTRIQQLLAQRGDDERYQERYTGIDPEQHMTPFADTYGLSDEMVEKYAPVFDRLTDYMDPTLLASVPFGLGAANAAAKTAMKTFQPIARGSKYFMPGSIGNIRRLATGFGELGTETLQNEGLAAGVTAAMPQGEPQHWEGRREGENRTQWHARNSLDRAKDIQGDAEADQKNNPLEISHVKDAVLRGGPGFRNLIAQNKHLQHEALETARASQAKEKAKYAENSRADTSLPY